MARKATRSKDTMSTTVFPALANANATHRHFAGYELSVGDTVRLLEEAARHTAGVVFEQDIYVAYRLLFPSHGALIDASNR